MIRSARLLAALVFAPAFALPLVGLLVPGRAHAPDPSEREGIPRDRPLVVATKPAPPFVMKTETGEWEGASIELWEWVASRLELDYELREATIPEMLAGLEDGTFDVSAAALTVTPEREARVDFTHPFHTTGLSIAVRSDYSHGWLGALGAFFSVGFLRVVLALIALLLICGLLVWIFERRANSEMFGGTTSEGVGSGFWWAAVTMTPVGYGDKAPRTIGGRAVALVWMFASLIVISGFTAAIASALTLGGLGSPVQGPEDLDKVRVGTVPQTTSAHYLDEAGLVFRPVDDIAAGLDALAEERIDALIYDRPILAYMARGRGADPAAGLRPARLRLRRRDEQPAARADRPRRARAGLGRGRGGMEAAYRGVPEMTGRPPDEQGKVR